jgi:tetratricopeptide (TPR) repeat protein
MRYWKLGEHEQAPARVEQAVTAYRKALQEYTRDRDPLNWARTKIFLGLALRTLGELDSDTSRIEEALVVFREALLEYTRERVPCDWALTQGNIGTALSSLGAGRQLS